MSKTSKTDVENSLYDYDSLYNEYDDLLIRLKTAPLSAKDSSRMFRLERKTEEYKIVYNERNRLLKAELPHFFRLVDLVFQPLFQITYYVHLTTSYQIHNNLSSLADAFAISVQDLETKHIVASFERDTQTAQVSLNELSIINFTENYLTNLTSGVTSYGDIQTSRIIDSASGSIECCEALFSFNGALSGDLKFKAGDKICILNKNGAWWKGELNGETGVFPSNYVKVLTH